MKNHSGAATGAGLQACVACDHSCSLTCLHDSIPAVHCMRTPLEPSGPRLTRVQEQAFTCHLAEHISRCPRSKGVVHLPRGAAWSANTVAVLSH